MSVQNQGVGAGEDVPLSRAEREATGFRQPF